MGNQQQGALFRQFSDRVEVYQDPNCEIEFDNVTGKDCSSTGNIAAKVYDVQRELYALYKEKWAFPLKPSSFELKFGKLKIENARGLAAMYRRAANPV